MGVDQTGNGPGTVRLDVRTPRLAGWVNSAATRLNRISSRIVRSTSPGEKEIGAKSAGSHSAGRPAEEANGATRLENIEIERFDPLLEYLRNHPKPVRLDQLKFASPAVRELHSVGIEVLLPLLTQGNLVGVIQLGPRKGGQGYSRDDLIFLENLAMQSAAAFRVGQLVREQQEGLRERERIAQQLRLARDIQKTLLPRTLPDLPGWSVSAYYQPAWEVGGDFYDFIHFPDGRIGIVIGDVTDKGMPSALVMASTRSLLRASAERDPSPAAVLETVNRVLFDDIPPMMFVTCFYLLLDPSTGDVVFANAGHDLPYRRRGDQVTELRATGMPLGLMPDMSYEEERTRFEHGETVVFYSDGLVEAHDPSGDMFGLPRLGSLLASRTFEGPALIRVLLDALSEFTTPGWMQEDDVTLVTISRSNERVDMNGMHEGDDVERRAGEVELARFSVPSAPGNEIMAIATVEASVAPVALDTARLERLKTAVGEAVMNGMEHANRFREDLPVEVTVSRTSGQLIVRVFDAGTDIPDDNRPEPNLDAKLAGLETPRGWGMFLIRNMVDEVRVFPCASGKTTELVLNLEESNDV